MKRGLGKWDRAGYNGAQSPLGLPCSGSFRDCVLRLRLRHHLRLCFVFFLDVVFVSWKAKAMLSLLCQHLSLPLFMGRILKHIKWWAWSGARAALRGLESRCSSKLQQRKWHSKAATTAEPDTFPERQREREIEKGNDGNSGSVIASATLCPEFRYEFSSEIILEPVAQSNLCKADNSSEVRSQSVRLYEYLDLYEL